MRNRRESSMSGNSGITSIRQYRTSRSASQMLYPGPKELPKFFETNLVSSQRVIKEFSGDNAVLRAFGYQIMKLTLDDSVNQPNYLGWVRQLVLSDKWLQYGALTDSRFTDSQYRSFFREFLKLAEMEPMPRYDNAACKYPIIDPIMLKVLQKLVPPDLQNSLAGKYTPDTVQNVYQFLCDLFKVTLMNLGECFRFDEADIFIYVQSQKLIYLAFKDEMLEVDEENSEYNNNTDRVICSRHSINNLNEIRRLNVPRQSVSEKASEASGEIIRMCEKDYQQPKQTLISILDSGNGLSEDSQIQPNVNQKVLKNGKSDHQKKISLEMKTQNLAENKISLPNFEWHDKLNKQLGPSSKPPLPTENLKPNKRTSDSFSRSPVMSESPVRPSSPGRPGSPGRLKPCLKKTCQISRGNSRKTTSFQLKNEDRKVYLQFTGDNVLSLLDQETRTKINKLRNHFQGYSRTLRV